MDCNYFLLFFREDSSFIIASRNFVKFDDDKQTWTSKEWLDSKEEVNLRYHCSQWSSDGVVVQVACQHNDLEASLKKARELRYEYNVTMADILIYFNRYKVPGRRNIIPSVSTCI